MSVTAATDPLGRALELMSQALEILDRENAPRHIGAHLDMAIHCLREALNDPRD